MLAPFTSVSAEPDLGDPNIFFQRYMWDHVVILQYEYNMFHVFLCYIMLYNTFRLFLDNLCIPFVCIEFFVKG